MPLAVVKTNLPKENIPKDFMSKLSDLLAKMFECNKELTLVEVLPSVPMMRAGTTDKLVNVEVHHTCDKVDQTSKKEFGKQLADFIFHQLHVDMRRILVLFFDTRCTTVETSTTNNNEKTTQL